AAALYARNGYSEEAIKTAGYAPAAAAPPVVNDNVTVTTPPGSNVAIMTGNGITREQAISATKNLLNHGVDVDTVAEAALAHGLEPKDFMTEPASKEAVEAQVGEGEVANGFEPPPEGEGYRLQYDPNFARANGEDDVAALAAINRDFEAGFKTAGVPAALAQPLLDSFLDTGERYSDLSPVAAETRWKEELAMFNKTSRNPEEDNRLAVKGFAALPKSLQEQLAENHCVHSAAARFQLAALGRALEYREGK
ncbi:MAG: hypothetical protein ACRD9W_15820, partial [Terriglobia bacterium]